MTSVDPRIIPATAAPVAVAGAAAAPSAAPQVAAPFALPADRGKISEFGGPGDVNSLAVSGGSTSNPPQGPYYCAMRWGSDGRSDYPLLKQQRILITAANGNRCVVYPGDWGPAAWTGRVIDVAPAVLRALNVDTDAVVTLAWVPASTPPGPVTGGVVPTGFAGAAAGTQTSGIQTFGGSGGGGFSSLLSAAFWKRVGMGVLGVVLLVAGAAVALGPVIGSQTVGGTAGKVLKGALK